MPNRRSIFPALTLLAVSLSGVAMAAGPGVRVKALRVEAQLANWDADVAPDGLQVTIYPLDAHGQLVPVHGRVALTLIGELEPSERNHRMRRPPEFIELERKSFQVRPADFANGPAVYLLPFRGLQPDATPDLAAQALIKARLLVPGQGAFDASYAQVWLRDFSRFRDQLELYRGRREW